MNDRSSELDRLTKETMEKAYRKDARGLTLGNHTEQSSARAEARAKTEATGDYHVVLDHMNHTYSVVPFESQFETPKTNK
jgi:hypothetical protein